MNSLIEYNDILFDAASKHLNRRRRHGVFFRLNLFRKIFIDGLKSLTKFEVALWIFSLASVTASFIIFPQKDYAALFSSLSGVSLVLFVAKGTVLGQVFTVIFSVLYGIISIKQRYFSEIITYLGMNTPIAIATMISWLRNPYKETAQIEVAHTSPKKWTVLCLSDAIVTAVFYFILRVLGTSNLVTCTISISTSYAASFLELIRSSYYAVFFMANDVVLIALWTMASLTDRSCTAMAVCFLIFFMNDVYGFYNWQKMKKSQSKQ